MKDVYFIVFDLGTQSIRGSVFDKKGNKHDSLQYPINSYTHGVRAEQDPIEWWNKSLDILNKLTRNDEVRKNLSGIGYIGTAYGVVPIGSNGEAIDKAITYYDKRAHEEAKKIANATAFKELSKRLGYSSSATHILEKILWIKENKPTIYTSTQRFLDPTGYLYFKATGEFAIDSISANKLYANPKTMNYPLELLTELGLDLTKLPKIVIPSRHLTPLSKGLIKDYNLPDVPVVYLTFDNNCALVGCGVIEEGMLMDNSGTGTGLKLLINTKNNIPNNSILLPHLDNKAMLSTYIRNTGTTLDNYCRIHLNSNFDAIGKHIQATKAGRYIFSIKDGRVYDSSTLQMIEVREINPDITRALAEGLAYPVREFISEVENKGAIIKEIIASGGVSRNKDILQIKADVTGIPIIKTKEEETTSLGGAVMVAVGTGYFNTIDDAVANMVHYEQKFLPNPELSNKYLELVNKYKSIS